MMIKRKILPALAAGLLLASTFACKTSEDNYRKAYEKAVEKQSEGIDSTIYNKIRLEARPGVEVVDGDTMEVQREYVFVTPNLGVKSNALKRFDVVVAQFKQLFHAKSMRQRMADNGYTDAFVAQTREPLYYVVVLATDDAAQAAAELAKLKQASPVKLIDPCPWVLRPANR
jgi:hypothetical protein